jgi:ABC-2 type transport system ATP-binding protein
MTLPLIDLTNVSMTYKIRHGAAATFKETIINTMRGKSIDIEVDALKDISFQVKPGEVLAVIGRNGAGKSTLLKIMARILPPTIGRVKIRGAVAPMIEIGAGFNGELTGRENIVLYGTLLGRTSKEMQERVDEIANWADLNDSINNPLRTYSSGMVAKLAFATATDKIPDVLLIDEILSVGDSIFQAKSKRRMKEMFHKNAGVVLVSHDLPAIRELATKVIWLEKGKMKLYGNVSKVLSAYAKV